MGDPIEAQILLAAAAKASVAPERLPELVERAQAYLEPRREDYRTRYETAFADDDREVFFVESGHWAEVGRELGFADREADAVRRAHEEQLLRIGRRRDRRDEFETALEIREAAVIGR